MTPGSTAINLRTRSLIVGAVLAGSAAVNGCGGSTGPSIASLATGSSRCVLSDFKTVSSGLSDNVAPSAPTSAMVCRLQNGRHLSQRPIGSQEAQLVLDKINDLPKLSKGASVVCGELKPDATRTALVFHYPGDRRLFVAVGPCGVVGSELGRRSLSGSAADRLVRLLAGTAFSS
jgi:hypothetical protein